MLESIAVGDELSLTVKVTAIVGKAVIVDIDGESFAVSPSKLRRTGGGRSVHAAAIRNGRQARTDGRSIAECPYENRFYKSLWIKGWTEAGE